MAEWSRNRQRVKEVGKEIKGYAKRSKGRQKGPGIGKEVKG